MAVISTMEILARDECHTIPTQEHMSVTAPNRMQLCGHIALSLTVKKIRHRNLINQENNPDAPPTHLTLNRHSIVPVHIFDC